jgi:hypothetical protein
MEKEHPSHEESLYFISRQKGSKLGTHLLIDANETLWGTFIMVALAIAF